MNVFSVRFNISKIMVVDRRCWRDGRTLLARILVLAAWTVLALPGVASAALSVMASPTSVFVGQSVSVTVSSSGCPATFDITVSFGDSTSTTVTRNTTTTVSHTYTAPGSFTITAGGTLAACSPSTATTTVSVSPAGTISSLLATPSSALVGQSVTFTVSGSGTCGSLTLTFGDASSTTLSGAFPLMATHAYSSPGTFTVTATGTSNCTGSASTLVTVTTPPGTITSLIATPPSALVGQLVTFTVSGTGTCGSLTLTFGDATSTTLSGSFPRTTTHTYGVPGTFMATATGTSSCTGSASTVVTVTTPLPGTITLLTPSPSSALVGQLVTFTVSGTGTCGSLTLTFGDATSTPLSGPFPLPTSHTYGAPGTFMATATGTSSCTGSASTVVTVTSPPPPGTITALAAIPSSALVGQLVTFTVSGTGTCGSLTLTFGDATLTTLSGAFPLTTTHAYATTGTFMATATGTSSCTGSASTSVTVLPGTITSLSATPPTAQVGQLVTFTVSGTGTCGSLTLTFGDATSTTLSGPFPRTTTHAYATTGTFMATATGTSSCTGSASTVVTVTTPLPGTITLLTASPPTAQVGQLVTFTVSGTGTCGSLTLTFGDATSTTLSGPFPRTTTHAYATTGAFTATATGTVSCTGGASAPVTVVLLPPVSVSVSVITTPAPAQVSQIQSIPVPSTYIFTANIPANLTLTSAGGSFVSNAGATIGTGGGAVTATIIAGRGVVAETLTVPQVVAERSLRGGSPLFNFQRTFSGGGVSVTAAVPMRVVSSAVGPFSLRRVELRFENGRGEITIPKDFEKLKALALVEFNGSGLLEAAWEVDGLTLAIIREFLTFGSLATLTTPEIPPLPTFEPGLHRVAFRITSPPATFEIPTITYFVTAATAPSETIELIAPADRTRLPQSSVTFEWKGVSGVVQYQIEVTEDEGAALVFSALATASPYRMPAVYERNFVTGKRYRWQVKGLDVAGNVVAFSKSRTFTWAPEPAAGTFVPRQVLAALKAGPAGVVAKVVSDLERRFTLRSLRTFDLKTIDITVAVFEISDAGTVGSAIFALQADRRVVFAQPNYLSQTAAVHTDPLASLQYGPRTIRADQAHDRTTGRGVRVAIVDTGIDTRQPDLRGRVTERANFAEGEGAFEEEVHGTMVAGVIAATADNGVGIYGIAPEAKIIAIRSCRAVSPGRPEGLCTSEGLARGIDHALLHGAKVINLSVGGPADLLLPRLVDRAVELGAVVVAAAGNAGPQAPAPFPAALPKVIAVTAVDAKNGLYPQATRGEFIDLAAPGVEIMTTMPGERFNVYSGTSMAAAHVSGIVALLFQVSPRASPDEIQRILEETAEDLGVPGKDRLYGSGRVDACRAVNRLIGPTLSCQ